MFSKNWPYYYNLIFWRQILFIKANTQEKWEEQQKIVVGGQKLIKKIDFLKKFDFVTSDFFAFLDVPMEAKLFVPYECAIKNYKKLAAGMKKQYCAKTAFPQPT